MANDQPPHSCVLSLPRELRDEIYDFTFTDQTINVSSTSIRACNAGLHPACQLTHHETLALFFKHSIFVMRCRHLEAWLSRLPQDRRQHIQRVRYNDKICRMSREAWMQFKTGIVDRRGLQKPVVRDMEEGLRLREISVRPGALEVWLWDEQNSKQGWVMSA